MEVYAIKDLNDYAYQLRELSAKSISENYTENLDDFISLGQLTSLILEKSQGCDENNHVLIDVDTNEDLFYIVCDWIYGVGLSKLASQNLIECAWDSKQNCMVFWSTEKSQTMEKSDESTQSSNIRDQARN
jgi:hypothetical protein